MPVPASLIDYLCAIVPGFSEEQARDMESLAQMLWHSTQKKRAHSEYASMFSYSKADARRDWGSDQRMRHIVADRYFEVLSGSNLGTVGYTNGFQPSSEMAEALKGCIEGLTVAGSSDSESGGTRVQRSLPRSPIRSMALGGKRKTKWKGIKPANHIRVDFDSLNSLRDRLGLELRSIAESGAFGAVGWQAAEFRSAQIRAALRQLEIVVDTARGPLCLGAVPIRYSEGSTGRLFAEGISLQSVPKEVRNAALAGCWDYDISNCHWTLIDCLAADHGYECTAIRHYLANKSLVRSSIAQAVGIEIKAVKECLLMLMYGAGKSVRDWEPDAIPKCIGADAARRLYRDPRFIALDRDVRGARRTILQHWPVQVGLVSNALGLQVKCTEPPAILLAHVLQGLEAKALMAVVRAYGDNIQLCIHDGWVARERLDVGEVQQLISDAIGVNVVVEEVFLGPVLAATTDPQAVPVDKSVRTAETTAGCGFLVDMGSSCASRTRSAGRSPATAAVAAGAAAEPGSSSTGGGLVISQKPKWNQPRKPKTARLNDMSAFI